MKNYVELINPDRKKWYLPIENMKISLGLYQPSSTKGKILKKVLPFLKPIIILLPQSFRKFGITSVDFKIDEDIEEYISNLKYFNAATNYAIFLGTPGIHQKTTIQIQSDNFILGYCKSTQNRNIFHIFKKEKCMLDYLDQHGVINIPKCISCNELPNGLYVFIQSTIKTVNSKVRHEFGKLELEFLKDLYDKTKTKIGYEKTDFYRSIHRLQTKEDILRALNYDIDVINSCIRLLDKYFKNNDTYAVCHRDFTPWNMFIEKNELFVFDFEYARYQYPQYIDAIHYYSQTSIFEKNLNAEQIWQGFVNNTISSLFDNPTVFFIAYLMDIISLYVDRETGEFANDVKKNLDIWYRLARIALNNIKNSC